MTKLNPCPDCGREPDFEEGAKVFRVACRHCGSTEFVTARTASGAVNAWNAATGDSTTTQGGKTLRDEFAMAALVVESVSGAYGDKAANAYKLADAMMQEREK